MPLHVTKNGFRNCGPQPPVSGPLRTPLDSSGIRAGRATGQPAQKPCPKSTAQIPGHLMFVGLPRQPAGVNLVGYARVSTLEQDPALQHDALTAAGVVQVFTDCASGATAARPQLIACLDLQFSQRTGPHGRPRAHGPARVARSRTSSRAGTRPQRRPGGQPHPGSGNPPSRSAGRESTSG